MACSTCTKTKTVTNPCTTGCVSTISTDCVIYGDEVLSFEDESSVEEGDKRTLTDILQQIDVCCGKESKILTFNDDGETDNGDAYTVLEEDTRKILLLTQTDDGTAGTRTYTITLPQTTAFIEKELEFKDISVPSDPGVIIEFKFNIAIQYNWNTTQTTDEYSILMDTKHKHLILRYVKVTPTSYQWIVASESSNDSELEDDIADLLTQIDDLESNLTNFSGDVENLLEVNLVEFEDGDLSNGWVTHALNIQAQKVGNQVTLRGYVKDGDDSEIVLTLPAGFRPPRLLEFTTHTSGEVLASIIIGTDGQLFVNVFGVATGTPITDYVTLSNVTFFTV